MTAYMSYRQARLCLTNAHRTVGITDILGGEDNAVCTVGGPFVWGMRQMARYEAPIAPCSISWFVERNWRVGSTLNAFFSSVATPIIDANPHAEQNRRIKKYDPSFLKYPVLFKSFSVFLESISGATGSSSCKRSISELLGCFQHRLVRCERQASATKYLWSIILLQSDNLLKVLWNDPFPIFPTNYK